MPVVNEPKGCDHLDTAHIKTYQQYNLLLGVVYCVDYISIEGVLWHMVL